LRAGRRRLAGCPQSPSARWGLTGAFDPREDIRAAAERADEAASERLAQLLERGDFDLIAIGRSLLANPEWGRILAEQGVGGLPPHTKEAVDELV
jgi:hypothetical protein